MRRAFKKPVKVLKRNGSIACRIAETIIFAAHSGNKLIKINLLNEWKWSRSSMDRIEVS